MKKPKAKKPEAAKPTTQELLQQIIAQNAQIIVLLTNLNVGLTAYPGGSQ
jgi:hypothetical protein